MSITDRELLEMAAKAAGLFEHKWSDAWKCLGRWTHDKDGWYFEGPAWNPLTDDGDALRLAVHLNLKLVFHPALNQAIVRPYYACKNEWVEDGEKHPDPYAATRRAIVRAATEIGRAMP